MKTNQKHHPSLASVAAMMVFLGLTAPVDAQQLINIDFGAGSASGKTGLAGTGLSTNDFWNLYRHYDPKFTPGMPLVADGQPMQLKLADRTASPVSVVVTNAPGVWGNSSGDPMYDTYIFSQNGSNLVVTLTGLAAGSYHFYLYGHADADVSGEQNSVFTLKTGTNTFGPSAQTGGSGWKVDHPWQDRAQYVVFRDVQVDSGPVVLEVGPGPNGIAVLNGLQILSRGTGAPRVATTTLKGIEPVSTNLLFEQIHYEGKVSDTEARFTVNFVVESLTTNELSSPLFEGDVALISPELPQGLRLVSRDGKTLLFCREPGRHSVRFDLLARITRVEPWNQVRFVGPPAAMASVTANASVPGVELQLLAGTQTSDPGAVSQLQGVLGADRLLSLRWQGKGAEVARKSLVTVDTTATVQVAPAVIKFTTALHYEILQAPIPSVEILLPPGHALTRLQGEQVRDWQVRSEDGAQILHVDFIKPVEKACVLTLFSEQPIESLPASATLQIPRPRQVERESGLVVLSADDTTVETESSAALRQVNAPAGALAAWRFTSGPVLLTARLKRIEPVLTVTDRVTARLEESRFLISHTLALNVEKAGVYGLELTIPPGLVVSSVKGEAIEDWKSTSGTLKLSFASRVLGIRKVDILLEQANKQFPQEVTVQSLGISGAASVTTQLGAASSPGILLKTAQLTHLREAPVESLPDWAGELLAFVSEQPDWRVAFSAEKLAPRVVADVFNLVTIGDGSVGGSATIRYGILNQGLQEFQVSVPAHWKNIEFTGANIRRKEQNTNIWTIALQEKAWGGYTLVITYDYQFDPKGATLDLAGAHPVDVERETGSLGVMTAASLKLTPAPTAEPLRRVDESEFSESDRALCTHPVLFAYKYTGNSYRHSVQITRFEDVPVLEAVADRTELTSVLTEEGQLLTQSSFMVKNNEKQFQRFKLPAGSEFWSSFVNGQPAKPERDGDWYLVPLPRDANRDQAFAVDIVYAQKVDLKTTFFPHRIGLSAPLTDIPNTYAEWQLFAPVSQRFSGFTGNMTVASGTTYGLHDAWQQFLAFYGDLIDKHLGAILGWFLVGLILVLIGAALRRGVRGAVTVVVLFAIMGVLAAMLLPALSRAKARAQRISAVNNLKQIGLAAKTWALDNGDTMPPNFEAMKNELATDKVLMDPNTGQRFIYVGTGKTDAHPEAILAYSPSDVNGRAVLFADGSVQVLSQEKFEQAMQRDASVPRAVISANVPAPAMLAAATEQNAAIAPQERKPVESTVRQMLVNPTTGLPVQNGFALSGGGLGGGAHPPAFSSALGAGVRPIRIEIPRAGQAFSFMKVLNAGSEPLNVSASIMRLKTYRTLQMVFQVSAFGFGLVLLWALWIGGGRHNFWMTVAAGLVIWAVASLLMMWRILHLGFIATVPALLLLLVGWACWKLWNRQRSAHPPQSPETQPPVAPAAGAPSTPPLLPLILLTSWASLVGVSAAEPPGAASDAVSVLSASYSGTANDKVAQLEVKLRLATVATNQTVPLFGQEVAVQAFSATGEARLLRQGETVAVLVTARTNIELQFKVVVKLGGDVTRRQLGFALPPALSSTVDLLIDEPDAEVEFPTAVTFRRQSANGQTRVEGVCGVVPRLELNWTPRVRRAAEISATVFVQNTSLITLGGGVGNTKSAFDYQVSQGELRQVRVQIPAEQRVLHVEGEFIRSWELKDGTLVVDLLKGVSPAYRLTVETEKLLEQLPANLRLEIPHAVDVKRETGLLALRSGEEIALSVEQFEALQRVDADEFYRTAADKPAAILSAFRFLKSDFLLQVRAQSVRPQVEAAVHNDIRIGSEQVRLNSQVDYTIKRAGLFALQVSLPPNYRVESVTGTNVSQWVDHTETTPRTLEVTFKERTVGAASLRLSLVQDFVQPPASLEVPGVHPLGVEKLSGTVTITTEHGLAAKTQSLEGLTEIPFSTARLMGGAEGASVSPQSSRLGYKFITPEPGPAPSWTLTVAVEAVEPWVRAEIMNTVSLTETLVTGRTLVKYEVANAPVKEFRIRIPGAFRNVDISGSQIRQRDVTNDQWRVELQGKVRGQYLLTITWELPKPAGTNLVSLPGIQALGVERENGFIALIAHPPLQVVEKSANELLNRIDVRELPVWEGGIDSATVLAYRYLRAGYGLTVEARRFDQAEVLQALIDSARFSTVVAEDGQMMTEAQLSVRNNGRQHLEVQLPPGTTVWSAFVAGEPVRPSRSAGKLLLPLTRELASDAPVEISLTFIGNTPFPRYSGDLSLVSPKFDVPLKNAHWDLYLPPDYEYRSLGGSMTRLSDINVATPAVQVYSLSEYNQQQQEKETLQKTELRYGLESARTNLTFGNLRQAMSSLSRAKTRGEQVVQEAEVGKSFKDIETDLRRAQSSNLLAAQNQYFYENAGRLGNRQVPGLAVQTSPADVPAQTIGAARSVVSQPLEDLDVAGLQWEKLEKAQQVTVAKVAPLHVNLPTRGIHLTFGQVLQTELGKPMTVRLLAENAKAPSWLARITLSLLGFSLLWVLMALVNRRLRPAA